MFLIVALAILVVVEGVVLYRKVRRTSPDEEDAVDEALSEA